MGSPSGPIAALQTVVDRRRSAPPILHARYTALYTRMLGELTGDVDLMTSGLHPDFELHSEDDDQTVLTHAEFTARTTAYAQSSSVMWMEWEQLEAGTDSISGYGRLIKVAPAEARAGGAGTTSAVMSTKRCAVFLEFENDDQLIRERVFPGRTVTRSVTPADSGIYGSAWIQGRDTAAVAAEAAHRSLCDPEGPTRHRPALSNERD